MRPVLFQWRGVRVHAYPVMLYVGLVLGVLAGGQIAHRDGLSAARVEAATLALVLPALVGARLLFVAYHWPLFRRHPGRILKRVDGGAAVYGGLLLAVPLSVPLLFALGLGFGAFWDLGMLTIMVGMTFTKIGCLLNGCCAGRVTTGPIALRLPNHRGIWRRRIPAQLLEAALAAAIAGTMLAGWTARPFPGSLFLGVVTVYGLARIALEATRETVDRVRGVSLNQAISAALVVLSCTALAVRGVG